MSHPKDEADAGYIIPDPSKVREDVPGDAGDEANVIRFSEEQALIEEQSHGIRPRPCCPGLGHFREWGLEGVPDDRSCASFHRAEAVERTRAAGSTFPFDHGRAARGRGRLP